MALGFVTVFGVFGALTISAAATVQRYLPYVTVVIGIVLVALGIWLLSGGELTALTPRRTGGVGTDRATRLDVSGTASATRSPRCRAPSGRFWR